MSKFFWLINNFKIFIWLIRGLPVSFSSFRNVENLKKYIPKLNTIIDVGANRGQFVLAAREYFPEAKIYSFEPCKRAFENFSKCFRNQKNISCFNFGLGDINGETEFYENSFDQISSFLRIGNDNKNIVYRNSRVASTKAVVRKLDDIYFSMDVVPPVLLKLDVQGFEDRVLKGGLKSLKNIDYILLEMAFEKLYENQLLFDDMYNFLISLDYRIIAPLGFNYGNDHRIIEIDALFERRR